MTETATETTEAPAKKKLAKKKPILWFWYAFQLSKAGHIVPTLISPEFKDPEKCKEWFKKMRDDKHLGPCSYRMAGWGSKIIIIE